MATLYSYELLFKAHHVSSLLHDLKGLMTSRSATKLSSGLPWRPEAVLGDQRKKIQKGIKGIRAGSDHLNSYCFSFAFPMEPAFRALAQSWLTTPENGIGCVWTSLTIGGNWGMLELTAAATSVSVLLGHQAFQQQFVNRLEGVSEAIVFNRDSDGSTLLYPLFAPWLSFRHADEYWMEELDNELDVDQYATQVSREIIGLRQR